MRITKKIRYFSVCFALSDNLIPHSSVCEMNVITRWNKSNEAMKWRTSRDKMTHFTRWNASLYFTMWNEMRNQNFSLHNQFIISYFSTNNQTCCNTKTPDRKRHANIRLSTILFILRWQATILLFEEFRKLLWR